MASPILRLSVLVLSSLALLHSATRITRDILSPPVREIYDHVLKQLAQDPTVSPTPKELILTAGSVRRQVVQYGDSKDFAEKLFYEELVNAKEEVLVSTFIHDKNGPHSPKAFREAVIELNRRAAERKQPNKIRFYIAYDPFGSSFFQSELPPLQMLFIMRAAESNATAINLPDAQKLTHIDLKVLRFHKGLFGALHSKMMLVDGRVAIIGSKNLDDDVGMEHMITLEGPVTQSFRADFKQIWKEPIPDLTTTTTAPASEYDPSVHVPMLVVSRQESAIVIQENAPQNQAWLKAIALAKQQVFIQTPNFATIAIADAVIDAIVKNKITVTIITSFRQSETITRIHRHAYGTNGKTMNIMYDKLQKRDPSAVSRLRWCWYIGKRAGEKPDPKAEEWSHIKFMSVDDQFVIAGSGNQDPQSWYHSRENNVLIDDPKTAVKMKELILEPQQSLQHCYSGAPGEKRVV